jgi:hypothetical protein
MEATATSLFSTSTIRIDNSTSVPSFESPPTSCGEQGAFTLTFDDLPRFYPTNDTDITQQPPIFSPYHHLGVSDGYAYAGQPFHPFKPISPPHVAVFLPYGAALRPNGLLKSGEIGNGPRAALSAYWFDAFNVYAGCDHDGSGDCMLVLTGYAWDPLTREEIPTVNHTVILRPCTGFEGCRLQEIRLPSDFGSLSGLQIQAFVHDDPKMFFVDDLQLSWSDNSCAAGLVRAASR